MGAGGWRDKTAVRVGGGGGALVLAILFAGAMGRAELLYEGGISGGVEILV
jgi:hypothetical protein